MAEIISYPEKSILSGNDYLLISDSQNSYTTKKTRVSDINALVFSNAIEGSGTPNYIPKFVSTKVISDSIIYNGTDTISIGAETNVAESRLNVYKTSDMTVAEPHVATFNEASSDHSASLWPGSGNNSADIYGSVSRSTFTGSGTLDQLMGANPVSRHKGSGTVQFVQGVQTTAALQGDGTAEFVYATYSKANINGTANTNVDAAIGGWHVAELNGENNVDDVYGTVSSVVLTKGTVNTSAVAHLIEFDQVSADTTVSNVYYIKAENDNLTATGEKFFIKEETGLPSQFSNKLILDSYGSGTYTGTATQKLAVDTNGNVIELPIGSGPVDGSGTANYLTKWIDSDTIGNSIAYDSGSQLLINATSAAFGARLYVNGDSYVTGGYQVGTSSTYVGKLVNSSGVLTLETASNRDIQFKSSTNVFMYIDDDGIGGKVGIGTTSPTQKVVIKKSSFGAVDIGATVASGATLLAAGGNEDYGTFFATQGSSDNYTGLIQQRKRSAATFYNLALNPYGGNVGIGTTSPSEKLEVDGRIKVQTSAGSLTIKESGSTSAAISGSATVSVEAISNFRVKTGSSLVENFTVLSTGNVGIGNTSPGDYDVSDNAILAVGNTATANNSSQISILSGSNGFGYLLFGDGETGNERFRGQVRYDHPNDSLEFVTAGSERMNINSSGNVGIGTTSPGRKLHVVDSTGAQLEVSGYSLETSQANAANGAILIGNNPLYRGVIDYNASSSGDLIISNTFNDATSGIRFKVSTSNAGGITAMKIKGNGNVGIGTTSPGTKLHVGVGSGATVDTGYQLAVDSSGIAGIQILAATNQSSRLVFGDSDDNDVGMLRYDHTDNSMRFVTNATEKARITGAGNVGIGTTSPSEKLQVYETGLTAYKSYTATNAGAILTAYQSTFSPFTKTTDLVAGSDSTAPSEIRFLTRTSGTSTIDERMRIDSSGNVGIGTTSPGFPLHVKNSDANGSNSYSLVRVENGINHADFGALSGYARIRAGGTEVAAMTAGVSYFYNSGTISLTLTGTGVGIGTTSPSAKLDISSTGTGDSMIIRNDDASSSAAPVLVLLRDSASAANGDYLGQIKFKGNSDTGAERVYAKVTAKISDATNGAEDSLIETAVRNNGANLIVSRQTNTDLKLINGTGLESDGDIYIPTVGKGPIIRSPDGTRYRIIVDNSGNLSTETA